MFLGRTEVSDVYVAAVRTPVKLPRFASGLLDFRKVDVSADHWGTIQWLVVSGQLGPDVCERFEGSH